MLKKNKYMKRIVYHHKLGFIQERQVCFSIQKPIIISHQTNRIKEKLSSYYTSWWNLIINPLKIKPLGTLEIYWNFINLIKTIYEKSTDKNYTNS